MNFLGGVLLLLVISWTGESLAKNEVLSLDHLTVWFDHAVRFYENEADNAYSPEDLTAMVDVVSTRFSKVILEGDGDRTFLNRNEIPAVIANRNKNGGKNSQRLASTVTLSSVVDLQRTLTMADDANRIHPGTVEAILYSRYFGRDKLSSLYRPEEDFKLIREKLNRTTGPSYKLGIIIDIPTCGLFKGPLSQPMKEVVSFFDYVVLVTEKHPEYKFKWPKDPQVGLEMFQTFFTDCEGKLKEVKRDIKVIPLFSCNKASQVNPVVFQDSQQDEIFSNEDFVKCWKLMSQWAMDSERELIMYEAFDVPQKFSTGINSQRKIVNRGWWRLKDQSVYEIVPEMFIEKLEDLDPKPEDGPIMEKKAEGNGKNVTKARTSCKIVQEKVTNDGAEIYKKICILAVFSFILVALTSVLITLHVISDKGKNL